MISVMYFSFGSLAEGISQFSLIEGESALKERWIASIFPVLEAAGVKITLPAGSGELNGRNGEHTAELADALQTLGEVYHLDLAAAW